MWLWVPDRASLVRDDSGGFSIQISNSRLHSRGTKRPRLADSFGPNQRAQGMPGARCARSLACKNKKHTSIVTTVTPGIPGIPRAMVLTVSFVLSPVTGLCCHRRLADRSANLMPASGHQNHTTSPSASRAVRQKHDQRPPHPAPR